MPRIETRIVALDCETTGVDSHHGALPFFVTMNDGKESLWWEWEVEPETRRVVFLAEDLEEIQAELDLADEIVLQNGKFDYAMLHQLYKKAGLKLRWDWDKVHDTLIAGHLLASSQPHDLTAMVVQELRIDIEPYEKRLKEACHKARRIARSHYPTWRIAKEGLEDMPSAKGGGGKTVRGGESESPWKFDTWLLKAIAVAAGYNKSHPWYKLLEDYSNTDSAMTQPLWLAQRRKLEQRGLYRIYQERMKVIPIACEMERRGVTISGARLEELEQKYQADSERDGATCVAIAKGLDYELVLPKSGNNKSLTQLCFGVPADDDTPLFPNRITKYLDLPILGRTESGNPSLDKTVLERYELELESDGDQWRFTKALRSKRKRDTALTYMKGYRRFWLPLSRVVQKHLQECEWFVLHPSLNPTGTSTLRWSSSAPNEQNISKQTEMCPECKGVAGLRCRICNGKGELSLNLRYAFGPAPGREWWSLDAKNIELRIPSYESDEQEMIELFERSGEPPYYGSQHILNFSTVYPDIWGKELREVGLEKVGPHCKKKYASTWYQWCKNGDFAIQYQCGRETADRAFHRPGCFDLLKSRFTKMESLNQHWIRFADKHGYVETMPDKSVDPKRGYPVMCSRTEWGKISPTIPLSYHVQSTAMWWMQEAMIAVADELREWNRKAARPEYFIAMQVHDELTLDFPKMDHPKRNPRGSNLPRLRRIQRLMESCGDRIGVPTPVGCEYHENNWAEGVTCD